MASYPSDSVEAALEKARRTRHSDSMAAALEKIRRSGQEISDRRSAQAKRRAYEALLFGKPKEDGYGPGLVTPNDLKPRRGLLKPVEKMLDDGKEAAEKPKS
uniref:Uncharacterized protein n=1 Tax=Noccaea caerulescens TaxID=107243 RepID=A0A1J3J5V0_NOCCA